MQKCSNSTFVGLLGERIEDACVPLAVFSQSVKTSGTCCSTLGREHIAVS